LGAGQNLEQHFNLLLYFPWSQMIMRETMTEHARFAIGDLVLHGLFDYRGVVVDVDPHFMLSDEWYETVARSRPPKDRPWYRVLVHDATHETYVAERNLEPDTSGEPVRHPMTQTFFRSFRDGHYLTAGRVN
jgi:heat shock protein HspQ